MDDLNATIAAAAFEQGFAKVGFARLRTLPRGDFYREWLADGRHGEMAYLANDPERRIDPRALDSRLRSIVSLAFPYDAPRPPAIDWRRELRGRIASYALGEDY